MKGKKNILRTLALTVALLAAGQSAWATTKTVTYTLSREKVEGRNYWALTHSGSTPFDGTTTVVSQSEDNATQATFQLPDGFIFTFNWNGGTVTNVSDTYFMCQNANVQFSLTWSGTSRYVTNVSVTDDQGNPSSLNGSGTATTDYNYAEQGSASYTLKTYANFVRLVITYSDAPGLSIFQSAGTNTYNIVSIHDLRHLADYVNNGGNNCYGLTFLQTKNITCDNTYIPIAHRTSNSDETSFNGTYDGQGYTVSGITANYSGNYVGLFGYNEDEGTIRNVVLASSTFTGYSNVGGIVGSNDGTVENCRVESSVNINAATNGSSNHGGIAGVNRGLVTGCVSAAAVSTPNNYTYSMANGGIVGHNKSGSVRNCLYTGTNVSVIANKGAIVGFDENNNGTFTNNYYTAINLGGVDGSDQNGAVRAATYNFRPAEIGTQTTAYTGGITAYEYGLFYQGLYYMSNLASVSTVALTLAQGAKDGVTAYWGTFYSGTHRYTLPAGAAAYTMDNYNKLYRLGTDGSTIPAGKAVVIIATTANVTLSQDGGSSTIIDHSGGNQLQGSDSDVQVSGGKVNSQTPYVLSVVDGAVGFRPVADNYNDVIPAHKAYYTTTQ